MELRILLAPFVMSALLASPVSASPETTPPAGSTTEQTVAATRMLAELAGIPSNSDNKQGVLRAASWLRQRFDGLGFETRLLVGAGNPAVFARRDGTQGAGTILFYLHYDTQPTGTKDDWKSTGGEPFSPKLLSGKFDEQGVVELPLAALDGASLGPARLYARGAADDKAPIVMHLMALTQWLARPAARRMTIKFLLDGEEEAGSPSFDTILSENRQLLEADLLVLCDGPMDAMGRPSVYLGARGDMHMRLRVRTGENPAHSGNYGLLPNAAFRLASLLATMKDPSGRVTIDGFLDDVTPPTPAERAAMVEASRAEPMIAAHLGASRFEGEPSLSYYERLLFAPHLTINHLASGRPGNQIPVLAEALLEIRLVTRQDPAHVFEIMKKHVAARMPDAELELLDSTPAGRMSQDDPAIARAIAIAHRAADTDLLVYPSLGGTLPLIHSLSAAGFKYVGLPLVNFDNNQHVGNENVTISALADGIVFLERLYEGFSAP